MEDSWIGFGCGAFLECPIDAVVAFRLAGVCCQKFFLRKEGIALAWNIPGTYSGVGPARQGCHDPARKASSVPYAAGELIGDLERDGAITSYQAKLLLDGWPLEDEWWSNPYLRTVREHSRAVIGQLRYQTANTPPVALVGEVL